MLSVSTEFELCVLHPALSITCCVTLGKSLPCNQFPGLEIKAVNESRISQTSLIGLCLVLSMADNFSENVMISL